MERLTRDEMLFEHAKVAAKRSTCSRLQVGAVFSREGRIISTGYNGAPKGRPHCNHECNCFQDWPGDRHDPYCFSQQPCTTANHAERNGVDFAARHGLSLEGSELHVTHAPCEACAGSILNVGINRVSFLVAYRLDAGVELLRESGIEVVDYRPSF